MWRKTRKCKQEQDNVSSKRMWTIKAQIARAQTRMRSCWKLAKEQKKVENITSNTMKRKVLFKMCARNYMHLEKHENRVHHLTFI